MHILKRLYWHLKNEKNLFQWIVSRLLFYSGAGRFIVIDCGIYKIHFFPSALSLAKWLNPAYGNSDEAFLRKILRPNDVFVDVGANIGTMTLAAASLVGERGQVVSFEPNPRVFEFLKKNVALNRLKNVSLHDCAVGERPGEVSFSDQLWDDQNKVSPEGERKIMMKTLDDQLSSFTGQIRLLKVDVEGYEKFVFMGADTTLARTNYLCFEVYEPHFEPLGYTTADLLRYLTDKGFEFYQFDDTGKETTVSSMYRPEKCVNVYAKRISARA